MKALTRFAVLVLASLTLAAHARAQIPFMQSEFQVSEGTTGYQYNYGVSIDRTGRFVVTWTDDGSSSSYDSFARLYDAAGDAEGGEFAIDPSDAHQYFDDVAKDQSGRFIVAWQEGETSVRARRFHADGTPAGASFPVNTGTLTVFDPRVASDPSGNFVVVWTREGVTDLHRRGGPPLRQLGRSGLGRVRRQRSYDRRTRMRAAWRVGQRLRRRLGRLRRGGDGHPRPALRRERKSRDRRPRSQPGTPTCLPRRTSR